MSCQDFLFKIRKGDTLPQLLMHLGEQGGVAPSFTGATARLKVVNAAGVKVIDRAGLLFASDQIDPLTGDPYNFRFAWNVGETDLPIGTYIAEIKVTFSGGGTGTFPSEYTENLRIKIGKVIG